MAIVKDEKPVIDSKYKIGDRVKVIKDSPMGMGSVEIGDIGVVTGYDYTRANTLGKAVIYLSFYEKGISNWLTCDDEVELVDTNSKQYKDMIMRELTDKYVRLQTKRVETLDGVMRSVSMEISNIDNKLVEKVRELTAIKALSRSQSKKVLTIKNSTNAYNMIETLLHNSYDNIDISHLGIRAITKPIDTKIQAPDKSYARLKLGQFKVELNYAGKIAIYEHMNNSNRGGYIHPHIAGDNIPCFGTYAKRIQGEMAELNILLVLDLIYDYLHSIDIHGWYIGGWYWATDYTDRCMGCGCFTGNCHCEDDNLCNDCGRPQDDCNCTRCPSSGEVMESIPDDYCHECRHWDKEDECCQY